MARYAFLYRKTFDLPGLASGRLRLAPPGDAFAVASGDAQSGCSPGSRSVRHCSMTLPPDLPAASVPDAPPPADTVADVGGRPKKSEAETRGAQVHVLMTPSEKAWLVETAGDAGLSVSEFVRRRSLGRRVESRVDLKTRGLIGRLGVNLNQLTRVANAAGQVQRAAELDALLNDVRAVLRALADETAPSL